MADEYKPQLIIDMLWPGLRAIQGDGPPVLDFFHRDGGYFITRSDGTDHRIMSDAEVKSGAFAATFNPRVREVLGEP